MTAWPCAGVGSQLLSPSLSHNHTWRKHNIQGRRATAWSPFSLEISKFSISCRGRAAPTRRLLPCVYRLRMLRIRKTHATPFAWQLNLVVARAACARLVLPVRGALHRHGDVHRRPQAGARAHGRVHGVVDERRLQLAVHLRPPAHSLSLHEAACGEGCRG
jgi:hypothetical protein